MMSHKEQVWRDAFRLDDLSEIDGNFLLAIAAAKKEFDGYSQGKWDLKNYIIWLNISENGEFTCISLIPKIDEMVGGIFFEIPYRGLYKYGRGYNFYYRLEDTELLEVVGMR